MPPWLEIREEYSFASQQYSLPEYFSGRLGCTSIKEAVNGTALTDDSSSSYISRYQSNISENEHIDLLICQLSTNDASKEKPLGNISESTDMEAFDTHTITGALEYIIAYTQSQYDCPVIFYTNSYYESDAYQAMVDRLYELQDKWDIGILDLYTDSSFNTITEEECSLYMYDTIHPTKAGYRDWWCPELEKQLLNYYNN